MEMDVLVDVLSLRTYLIQRADVIVYTIPTLTKLIPTITPQTAAFLFPEIQMQHLLYIWCKINNIT